MKRLFLIVLPTLLIAGCATALVRSSRAGYESAQYTVAKQEQGFELRDYLALTLVTTTTPKKDMDGSFMRLFRFITGENEKQAKIAMTTPVFIERGETTGSMSFVMPADMAAKDVPAPKAKELAVQQRPTGRYAVLRFRGDNDGKGEAAAADKLKAWVKSQQLVAQGEVFFAYYDPPWIPEFLCRSEALLRVEH